MRFLFLIVLAFLTLPSCNKDENNPDFTVPKTAEAIQGRWQLVTITHLDTATKKTFTVYGRPEDYMGFTKDSLKGMVNGVHQDARYVLYPNDSMLLVYDSVLTNGARETVHIRYVTANAMEIRGHLKHGEIGIMSLKK